MKQGRRITFRVYRHRMANGGGTGWCGLAAALASLKLQREWHNDIFERSFTAMPGWIDTCLMTVWADGTELYGPPRRWRSGRERAYPYARSLV